ncbi:MAG: ArgE/DapE family deacylase [Thermodesulfobacteriota bacterium]
MKNRILKKIEETTSRLREEMTGTLQELVRIPSVIGNEGKAQDFMRRQYEEFGLEVFQFTANRVKVRRHPAYCDTTLPYEGRPNVIGIWKGNSRKRSIILNGHVDTVSPEPATQWTHAPFGGEVEDGRLYGRGALDMKAGLVANLFALKVLRQAGIDPGGTVMLQSVIEEEDGGGGGALACFLEGYTADGMIVTEPVPWVNIALAGIMRFLVRVKGKSAHPSQSHLGVSAIAKMIPIFEALEQLDARRKAEVHFPLLQDFQSGGPSCHLIIGTFHAGDHIATLPGAAEIGCRIGFIPGETREGIRCLVERTICDAADQDPWLKDHPPEIEWLFFQVDPYYQDPDHPFVRTVISAARKVAGPEMEVKPRGGAWSEDTRLAGLFGFPALSMGPTGEHAHGVDEYVDLDSLERTTKALALAIADWCSQDKDR